MGHVNANLLSDTSDTRYLRDLFSELSLKVVNHGPTNFPLHGQPLCIDLICFEDSDVILNFRVGMPTFHSCQAKIEVTLEKFVPPHTVEFTYRNIKGITSTQLAENLNGYDWSVCQPGGENLDDVLHCISN